jgi:hypothetical protein
MPSDLALTPLSLSLSLLLLSLSPQQKEVNFDVLSYADFSSWHPPASGWQAQKPDKMHWKFVIPGMGYSGTCLHIYKELRT